MTLASGDTTVDEYIYPTLTLCITPLSGAMLINLDVVDWHTSRHSSVLEPIYKCLTPEEIVCISASNELIIVLSSISKKHPNHQQR